MAHLVRIAPLLVPLALSTLWGCASAPQAISLSLTQLGTEEKVDAGSFWGNLKHRSSYNLTGLGAMDVIGMVSLNPDPPSFTLPSISASRLPDSLALRMSMDCSKVASVSYDNKALTTEIFNKVRTALVGVQTLQNNQVELLSKQAVFTALVQAQGEYLDAKAASPQDAALTQQKKAILDKLSQGVSALPAGDDLVGALRSANAVDEKTKAIADALTSNTQAMQSAQSALDEGISTPGMVVSRWARANQKVTSFSVAGAASASSQASDQRNGYLLLGNPRVDTLLVGDDLVWRSCKSEDADCKMQDSTPFHKEGHAASRRSGIDSITKADQQYVTTYQLLARHWSWIEDRTLQQTRQFHASLSALITALKPLAGAADLVSKLESVDMDIQSLSSLSLTASNSGVMSAPSIELRPFSFAKDSDHVASVGREIYMQRGYGRIISTRTTLDYYAAKGKGTVVVPQSGIAHCGALVQAQNMTFPELEKSCQSLATPQDRIDCTVDLQQVKKHLYSTF